MAKPLSLSKTLKCQAKEERKRASARGDASKADALKARCKARIEELQLELLHVQQGIWHRKARAVLVFEGFDASGKGGCIRALTERLDPRGVAVHPIGPPTPVEQGTHWLYRFWVRMPPPGQIAIFDRSWYGRVLVERVEGLAPKAAWTRAYDEINEFERMLTEDGVEVFKFFLAVSPEEQLKRFRERLENPYKRWKISLADVEARRKWGDYVDAADDLLEKTHAAAAPWWTVPSDDKTAAHLDVLELLTGRLGRHREWLESQAKSMPTYKEIRRELHRLERIRIK